MYRDADVSLLAASFVVLALVVPGCDEDSGDVGEPPGAQTPAGREQMRSEGARADDPATDPAEDRSTGGGDDPATEPAADDSSGPGAQGGEPPPTDRSGMTRMEPAEAPDEPSPCDPTEGGKVSSPGKYDGYSEAIYPDVQRSSLYVEVRDGTRLAMDLFRPVAEDGSVVEEPLPVLWMHTPYNRRTFLAGPTVETYPGFAARLIPYGYVVAIVDFRGLFASFGKNIAYNRGEWVDAARMDAYDITEWLAEQPWSSGKIGMWGCSATGGSQMQAATTAPPHLRAIFPMSCEFDVYPFGVPGGMAPSSGNTRTAPNNSSTGARDLAAVPVDGSDGRSLLQRAIAEHADNVDNAGYVPFRDSVAENVGEPWWIKSSPHTYLDMVKESGVGIYVAANWDEGATKHGAFFTFKNLQPQTKLIAGPAGHCEWTNVRRETDFDLVIEELRFFDYWLKDIQNCVMEEPPVYYYTYNAPGDGFAAANSWPLPNEQRTHYYLGEQSLGNDAPKADAAQDSVMADADGELVYTTEPLARAVQITGHPAVDLWVSSTAEDGDFIATLQDVAPDGTTASYFMEGRLRASHRALEDPPYDALGLPWHPFTEAKVQPLSPGEATLLSFELLPISIIFPEGHRIRLVLTFSGSTTPRRDPAPTVSIYRDADHPSSITLPVIE